MGNSPVTSQQILGSYALRKKLGEGAMGQVWLAHDQLLDRDVAIKLLREGTANPRLMKDFLREAQTAAKLNHPNTVTIYQIGEHEGQVFIAMEYVEAGSLADELESKGSLPWLQATQAVRDAAAGLQAAHERGMVHRDVKPSNLMRSSRGVVKVVDFGLAKARDGSTDVTMTQPGMLMGSPAYMSPEQCRGEVADSRSDLYSLICAYYQLLTRQIPFVGAEATATMFQHCYEPFPDPRSRGIELPDGVCRILEKGSRKNPAERYQNAAELLADLDVILHAPQASHVFSPGTQTTQYVPLTIDRTISFRSIIRGQGIMGKLTWTLSIGVLLWLSILAVRHRTPGIDNDTVNAAGLAPVPALSAQYSAEQTIRNIFKDEFAGTGAAAKQALALKLLDQGKQNISDPVMRFVLFRDARDLAAGSGNINLAFQAIDETATQYAIDVVDLKTTALITASIHTISPEENHALAETGLALLDQAAASDHFAAAARLAPVLDSIAHKSKDIPVLSKVMSRNRGIVEQRREFENQRAAFEALRKNPADPEANLAVGRYLCFLKGNWDSGIGMLAQGSDAAMKNLGKKELANPSDAKTQLAIADGWWELAEKQPPASKVQIERHASQWYQKSAAGLSGADQTRAEARMPKDAPPVVKPPVIVTTPPPPSVTPARTPPAIIPPPARISVLPSDVIPQPLVRPALPTEPPSHMDAENHRVLNLMPIIDIDRAGSASWRWEGTALTSIYGRDLLMIPYEPPEEFDFAVELEATQPGMSFAQIFRHGGCSLAFIMSSKNSEFYFDKVSGPTAAAKKNLTHLVAPNALTVGKRYTFTVHVRNNGLSAYRDKDLLLQFPTDYSEMVNYGGPTLFDGGLSFHAYDTGTCLLHRLELTEITGKGHGVTLKDSPRLVRSYNMMEPDHARGGWRSVHFTPDGQSIVSLGRDVSIWDRASGKLILYWHNSEQHPFDHLPAAISSDERFLVGVDGHGHTVVVDLAHVTSPSTVLKDADMYFAAFSPDATRLVTGNNRELILWDAATGKNLQHAGISGYLHSIRFSPDAKRLLCSVTPKDHTLAMFDAQTLARLWTGVGDEVAYFSHDGTKIMSGMKTVLNAADGKVVSEYPSIGDINEVSPGGLWVVAARSGYGGLQLAVRDIATGDSNEHFRGRNPPIITCAAWSPDGGRILVGCPDAIMRLFDAATGQELETFAGHAGNVWTVAFSPDGKFAASACDDAKLRIFSLPPP